MWYPYRFVLLTRATKSDAPSANSYVALDALPRMPTPRRGCNAACGIASATTYGLQVERGGADSALAAITE